MKDYSILIADKEHRIKFVNRLVSLMNKYMSDYKIKNIEEACDKIGISHQSYYSYIDKTPKKRKDKTEYYSYPGYDNLYSLAKEFKVPGDYLLCLSDEDKTKEVREIEFDAREISTLTGLDENIVYQLLYDFKYLSDRVNIINFFFEINEDAIPLIKKSMLSTDEDEKEEIRQKVKKIIHSDKNNNNTKLLDLKRRFLNCIYFFVFEKVKNVDYFDENEGDFKQLDTVYLTNEYSTENGIIGDTYEIKADIFDTFYLDKASEYLTDIRKDFQKENYEKYHSSFKDYSSHFKALKEGLRKLKNNKK